MAEPITISAAAVAIAHFVGHHALAHTVGGQFHHLYRHFLERWREGVIGHPRNHDLEEASEKSFRGAVLVLVLELAGKIEPKKSWLKRWAEKQPLGRILAMDLIPGAKDIHKDWLNALRKAVESDQFKNLHRHLKLDEGNLRKCFTQGDVCKALGPGLADAVLEWTRFELQGQEEHPDFETLVREGWSAGEAPAHGKLITLADVYCLFFREHLKANTKVFRILVTDTLTAIGGKLDALGGKLSGELKLLRDQFTALAAAPAKLDLTAFEDWLEPQLGEVKTLLGDVKKQLDDLAHGQAQLADSQRVMLDRQDGFACQHAEILTAVLTLNIEVRRGNLGAAELRSWMDEQLRHLRELLQRQQDEQMAAHGKTHESLQHANERLARIELAVNMARPLSAVYQNLESWRERLDYLQKQEAIIADVAQKFALSDLIQEAKAKIVELGAVSGSQELIPPEFTVSKAFGVRGREQQSVDLNAPLVQKFVFALPDTHRKNRHFVPKPEIQAVLASLRPGDVVVFHGLGGVGKTQHVVQHAHEHRADYGHVLWASTDTAQNLRESLAALADRTELGLPIGIESSSEEKIRALRDWLANEERWLLVFDNADSAESAREIQRFLPPSHRGHVLITAQFTEWTSAFQAQPVVVWNEAQAIDFLARRLESFSIKEDALARLAQEFGGLPLALEQAAAYIVQTRVSAHEYLQLLARHRKALLARHHCGMTGYRASVATTWQVTIRRLSFLSRYILHIAACLASEPIPRQILNNLLSAAAQDQTLSFVELARLRRAVRPPDAVNLALAELARYSLASLSEASFRIHPLLQTVVRDTARIQLWHYRYRLWRHIYKIRNKAVWEAALWPQRAANHAARALPESRVDEAGLIEMRQLAPHIEAVLRHLPKETFGEHTFHMGLVGRLEWFRTRITEYEASVEALREILVTNAVRTPRLNVETEWFFTHFDELYKQAVRKGGGEQLAVKLSSLAFRDRKGPSWWTAYEFLRTLASRLVAAGDVAIARRLFRFCYDHAASDPDADPCERGRARVKEALSLASHTTAEELLSLLDEGVSILERHEGIVAIDIIEAVYFYAVIANTPERKSRALGWLRRAIPSARMILSYGCNHACVLTLQLVRLLRDSGQTDEALAACEGTLRPAIRSRKLDRTVLAALWQERGDLLKERQRYLAAGRSYVRCLASERPREKESPLRHVELNSDAGEMFRRAGCVQVAARRLLEAATLLDHGWSDDADYAEILATLVGIGLGRVDRRQEGEALLRRAIASRNDRLGPDDPKLALPHRLFGIFLYEADRLSEAEIELRCALTLRQKDTRSDDPNLLPYIESLATLLENTERSAEACSLWLHCPPIKKRPQGTR